MDPSFLPKINSLFHCAQEFVLPDFCPDPVIASRLNGIPLTCEGPSIDTSSGLRLFENPKCFSSPFVGILGTQGIFGYDRPLAQSVHRLSLRYQKQASARAHSSPFD